MAYDPRRLAAVMSRMSPVMSAAGQAPGPVLSPPSPGAMPLKPFTPVGPQASPKPQQPMGQNYGMMTPTSFNRQRIADY